MNTDDQALDALTNADFWRWLLSRYDSLPEIPSRFPVIRNVPNLFTDNATDLHIHLQDFMCYDDDGNDYKIGDYVAILEGIKANEVNTFLMQQTREWERHIEEKETKNFFWLDEKNKAWYERSGQDRSESKMVANFNLIFLSIIKIHNAEINAWERHYECRIEFKKDGKTHTSEVFRLTPDDCLSVKSFQKAVWQIDFIQVFFGTDTKVQFFLTYLNEYYKPRVVVQFDHFGFISYNRRRYYLTQNCLVKIPQDKNDSIMLVAPDGYGCYWIEGNDYIQLDQNIKNAPRLELGPVDRETNLYLEDMRLIRDFEDPRNFESWLTRASDHLCQMIGGGNGKFYNEGKLILGYIFSFHFFEDIYKTWAHILFLYLYGAPNTGKGKMAEVILTFFGIPTIASLTEPTTRALENALATFSQIPTWIDEFRPEIDGKRSKISDQLFNVWFELRTRQTSSGANRKRNEDKIVRTMIMFCSNYMPQADHLNSRAIKLEYAHFKRGDESSYHWLMDHKRVLQHLFIAYMGRYPALDRSYYRRELYRYKKLIKEAVKKKLEEKSKVAGEREYHLEDRQIQQMASIIVTHNFIYRLADEIRSDEQNIEKLEDGPEDEFTKENLKFYETLYMQKSTETGVFEQGIEFLAATAQEVGERDPLSDFLSTCGYLVAEGTINKQHYDWGNDGSLKIWFSGIWSCYEKFKGQNCLPKDVIRRKIELMANTDSPKTVNWRPDGFESTVRQKGYQIPTASKDKRFAYAFRSNKIVYGEEDSPL